MQLHEIRKALHGEAYDFLRTNPHLGSRVMLLGLGGSHAYGTDTETSDLDIRGCAALSKAEILCGESFEQVTDVATDTTIYAFPKLIHLLKDCNPNTIELIGLKPEHYLYLSGSARLLLPYSRESCCWTTGSCFCPSGQSTRSAVMLRHSFAAWTTSPPESPNSLYRKCTF